MFEYSATSSVFLVHDTGDGMGDRKLYRRCAKLADSLDIPVPFDLEGLCTGLGAKRNRTIRLVPRLLPPGGPSGLLLGTDHTDYVIYDQRVRPFHRDHIVLHELGHLVWGHEIAVAAETATAQRLLPRLSPELVRRMLFRSQFSDIEERQAEVFASVMLERFSYQQVAADGVGFPGGTDAANRLVRSLSHHPSRDRDRRESV